MIASTEGNYDNLGPLRAIFFRAIESESGDLVDLVFAVQLLGKLTADGRDVSGMEEDLARVLHTWIETLVKLVVKARHDSQGCVSRSQTPVLYFH
jgi:hypothetical protein